MVHEAYHNRKYEGGRKKQQQQFKQLNITWKYKPKGRILRDRQSGSLGQDCMGTFPLPK